jgi:hypothetical protein
MDDEYIAAEFSRSLFFKEFFLKLLCLTLGPVFSIIVDIYRGD